MNPWAWFREKAALLSAVVEWFPRKAAQLREHWTRFFQYDLEIEDGPHLVFVHMRRNPWADRLEAMGKFCRTHWQFIIGSVIGIIGILISL